MKRSSHFVFALLFVSGCQTAQLRHTTVEQAGSVTDLYYRQVMNNIAMLNENPTSLPFFSQPQTGQTTAQCSLTISATPEWDLVTSATRLLGVFAFAKQAGMVSGSDTNIEMWNTAPTVVPDKIVLMKYAYEVAFGNDEHLGQLAKVLDAEYKYFRAIDGREEDKFNQIEKARKNIEDKTKEYSNAVENTGRTKAIYDSLKNQYDAMTKEQQTDEIKKNVKNAYNLFVNTKQKEADLVALKQDSEKELKNLQKELGPPEFSLTHFAIPYTSMLHSGWFEVGPRHHVPKNARYVGHYGKAYAWVRPGEEDKFAEFTLVILNIATFEAPDREKRSLSSGISGKVAR